MKFTETPLSGAFILEVNKLEDDRGFFGRSWCRKELEEHGIMSNICQINTSRTLRKGTIRGMHFQADPWQEQKFVRCTRGRIFDVMVDLRPESPTFLKWFGTELTEDNYKIAFIPENFAHGFVSLVDDCEVYYPVTQFYTPGAEHGFRWNDPLVNIQWPVEIQHASEKDRNHPDLDINQIK
jgi:dTDP-4-dehydrorhamnose 3,5-epimerase